MDWFRRQQRDLPWRRYRDPYRIWIAEVMLQQTQVATVKRYYQNFFGNFPYPRAVGRSLGTGGSESLGRPGLLRPGTPPSAGCPAGDGRIQGGDSPGLSELPGLTRRRGVHRRRRAKYGLRSTPCGGGWKRSAGVSTDSSPGRASGGKQRPQGDTELGDPITGSRSSGGIQPGHDGIRGIGVHARTSGMLRVSGEEPLPGLPAGRSGAVSPSKTETVSAASAGRRGSGAARRKTLNYPTEVGRTPGWIVGVPGW